MTFKKIKLWVIKELQKSGTHSDDLNYVKHVNCPQTLKIFIRWYAPSHVINIYEHWLDCKEVIDHRYKYIHLGLTN